MKVCTLDLENTPLLTEAWTAYEADAVRILRPQIILCVGYKFLHEKKARIISLDQYPGYRKDKFNDFNVIQDTWKLLDESDVVITHNGDQHDLKLLNARFFFHGLGMPSPFISIDTKKLAKRFGRFPTNKLKHIREYKGNAHKEDPGGYGTWVSVMEGDAKAWARMKKYCMNDVVITEQTYLELRPYIKGPANFSAFYERDGCPNCGRVILEKRGFSYTRTGRRQRYQCTSCGAWSVGKHEKLVNVQ